MRISFVIPAHNEQALLPRTLASIHVAAAGFPYEIVVANDASTDGTAACARAAGARVVDVNHRQIAATRNAGARAAQGDVFVFLDADTLLPAVTLRRALDALRNGAVGGGARVIFDAAPWLQRQMSAAFTATWITLLRWAAGCFVFATREAFEAVGGFDEQFFVAEELYMSRALKRQGRFVLLATPVVTSARKLHLAPLRAMAGKALRLLTAGPRAWRDPTQLDLWYGPDLR